MRALLESRGAHANGPQHTKAGSTIKSEKVSLLWTTIAVHLQAQKEWSNSSRWSPEPFVACRLAGFLAQSSSFCESHTSSIHQLHYPFGCSLKTILDCIPCHKMQGPEKGVGAGLQRSHGSHQDSWPKPIAL